MNITQWFRELVCRHEYQRDFFKVIKVGEIMVASGWECNNCHVIYKFNDKKCPICPEMQEKCMKCQKLLTNKS